VSLHVNEVDFLRQRVGGDCVGGVCDYARTAA
jgi:hypothetical protein